MLDLSKSTAFKLIQFRAIILTQEQTSERKLLKPRPQIGAEWRLPTMTECECKRRGT